MSTPLTSKSVFTCAVLNLKQMDSLSVPPCVWLLLCATVLVRLIRLVALSCALFVPFDG